MSSKIDITKPGGSTSFWNTIGPAGIMVEEIRANFEVAASEITALQGGGGGGGGSVPIDGSVPMTGPLTVGGYGIVYSFAGNMGLGQAIAFGFTGNSIRTWMNGAEMGDLVLHDHNGNVSIGGALTVNSDTTINGNLTATGTISDASGPLSARIAALEARIAKLTGAS